MKTFKQFNEEAQYHLHEIDRVGFGIPGAGLMMKGLGYLNRASIPIYRGYGAYETGKKVYQSIKDKKGPARTALTALSGLQYAAPLNRGKNFVRQMGNFIKSKRFLGGVGAEVAGELIDDAEKEKKKTTNNKVDTASKVSAKTGAEVKKNLGSDKKKYLTDLDLYKK